MARTGKLTRAVMFAALAALAGVIAFGAIAGAKKKPRKMPRGPYPALGCPVFPASSAAPNAPSAADQTAWNQDVSQAPLADDSAAVIAHIAAHGGDTLHPDFGSPRAYGFPYAVTGKRQKRTRVRFTAYGDESDRGPYRVPLKALVEGGQRSDGDRHVLSVDRRRCRLQELYRAFARKRPKPPHWEAASAAIWNLRSAALRPDGWTSADAAGLPIFPGLVRYDEVRRGSIGHAIRVTFSSTRDAWVRPASHCAGDTPDPSAPPMGMRLRLSAGYDISGFGGAARVIAVALKHYGMIVADNGSNWFISGTSDRRWDDEDLDQLKAIPGSAFEVVRSAAPAHTC
ncbi:MAG: hypothetical protein ACXWFN_10355 [Solirubrobacterales bacterium]